MSARFDGDYCPQCGASLRMDAKVCPECGSDDETGWSEKAYCERLGISDDEFDYENYLREEFGQKPENRFKPAGMRWLWWVVAILVVLGFLFSWLHFD